MSKRKPKAAAAERPVADPAASRPRMPGLDPVTVQVRRGLPRRIAQFEAEAKLRKVAPKKDYRGFTYDPRTGRAVFV